jgi:DUF971 family protein
MTPQDIIVRDKGQTLVLVFSDGEPLTLSAEYLRVESPSAEVQGHNESQKKLVAGKRNVAITGVEPVGNYAIRLTFSDGHSTGIYSWSALSEMARNHDAVWARYLTAIEERGLSREG